MNEFINQVIKHYRITEEIALGGMGTVYKAVNQKLNRDVAIKVINPNLVSNPGLVNSFYKEAKIQAKMNHINIVTVFDFFEHKNNHYLVMEYLGGESLDKIIEKKGPFDIVTSLSIFKQMLSGLIHAHAKAVIHKDIKSSNFIITPIAVKITDFGISQIITDNSNNNSHMGTLDYMSPEQILGRQVDYRTDLYSMSIVFYEILTGKSPYGIEYGSEHEIRRAHLELDSVPLTSINKRIPKELSQIILKGLSKNPGTRYQSANDYMIAIDSFIEKNSNRKINTMEISQGAPSSEINLKSVNFTNYGDIKNTPFHKILVDIYNSKQTGFLYIDSNIKLQIYFQSGYIANVRGFIDDLTLGQLLIKTSTITEEDQRQAVNFSLETGLKIGEVLITMNKISSHELSSLLEHQIKEKLHRGFFLKNGKFAFKELDQVRLNIAYHIHPLQVIYDHVLNSRFSSLDTDLWERIINTTYRVNDNLENNLRDIKFSKSKEVRIIDNLKKTNKLIKPAADLHLKKEDRFKLLHFLIISDLIEEIDKAGSNMADTPIHKKDIKVKYEIKKVLSSGITMSYKEQLDIPANTGNSQRKQTAGHQTNGNKQPHPDIKQVVDEDDDKTVILTPEEKQNLINNSAES